MARAYLWNRIQRSRTGIVLSTILTRTLWCQLATGHINFTRTWTHDWLQTEEDNFDHYLIIGVAFEVDTEFITVNQPCTTHLLHRLYRIRRLGGSCNSVPPSKPAQVETENICRNWTNSTNILTLLGCWASHRVHFAAPYCTSPLLVHPIVQIYLPGSVTIFCSHLLFVSFRRKYSTVQYSTVHRPHLPVSSRLHKTVSSCQTCSPTFYVLTYVEVVARNSGTSSEVDFTPAIHTHRAVARAARTTQVASSSSSTDSKKEVPTGIRIRDLPTARTSSPHSKVSVEERSGDLEEVYITLLSPTRPKILAEIITEEPEKPQLSPPTTRDRSETTPPEPKRRRPSTTVRDSGSVDDDDDNADSSTPASALRSSIPQI